jgi:DNA-directed RNA polymerase subunit F
MIKSNNPLSMSEVVGYIKKNENKEVNLPGFIKKFVKIKEKEAKELKGKIEDLDFIKLKEEDIIKIIDVLPTNEEELNKIFVGTNLDEDERKKILETVKEFK